MLFAGGTVQTGADMAKSFFNVRNIEELDFGKLIGQLPNSGIFDAFTTRGAYIRAIVESYDVLKKYEINTSLRLAHFFGQGLVETGYLAQRVENLRYSTPERLVAVFPRYFSSVEEARPYAGQPERLANLVYANRMENGGPESGDGWRYRGRGFIQLTGRENYRIYSEITGLKLLDDPDMLVRDLKKSVLVGAAFFHRNGLNKFADDNNVIAVSRAVNRGDPTSRREAHAETDRIQWTSKALALVRDPQTAIRDGTLRQGDVSEEVRAVQTMLARLNYPVGRADGIFGQGTRRAVLAFQDEAGLPLTGEVDPATRAALEARLRPPGEAPPAAPTPPVKPRSEAQAAPAAPAPEAAPAPGAAADGPPAPTAPTPIATALDAVAGEAATHEAQHAAPQAPPAEEPPAPSQTQA